MFVFQIPHYAASLLVHHPAHSSHPFHHCRTKTLPSSSSHIALYDRRLPYASTHLVSRPVYYLQFDSSPRHGGFKWEHCRPILYSKLAACCHCAPNVCGDCLCFRSNEKTMHVMSPMLVTRVAMSASHPVNATMILPYYHAPRARAPCPRAR